MKNLLTCEESRDGLWMLVNDIKGFLRKPYLMRFGFVDVLKIVLVTTLCGFARALGSWFFGVVISL